MACAAVVSIRIDRRKTLSDLKKLLEQHVGVASTQFKAGWPSLSLTHTHTHALTGVPCVHTEPGV